MGDYEKIYQIENLERGYRWIQSNPDAKYKNYFRDAYTAYAASSELNLKRLKNDLLRKAYEPTHASKIYLPKASGILRPYTLLTVNDQIVYQACINIVAEKLSPLAKKRYGKTVFGNLYAGKTSKFFYLRWQNNYRKYTKNIIEIIEEGYKHVANFDLASFYDSIDHHVLKHFLNEIKIDQDLIDFLLRCLKIWTSSTWTNLTNIIYIEHGIPQGPLSSGLLAEVVLQHFDKRGERPGLIKYLRYVDDIKIFAKTETPLRQRLVSLDLAAKEIGLFPQSTKINIREVNNPLEEIKSVSMPPESSVKPKIEQNKLQKRLLELSRGSIIKVEDSTRFKYLIPNAKPSHKLNERLLNILEKQPEFFYEICLYFKNYSHLPPKIAKRIINMLNKSEIYHAVNSNLLNATLDNMGEPEKSICLNFCFKRLLKKKEHQLPLQPTYKAVLIAWLLCHRRLNYTELNNTIKEEIDWWVKKDFVKYLNHHQFGYASYKVLLNQLIRLNDIDVARCAALKMIDENVSLKKPYLDVNDAAQMLLKLAGRIPTVSRPDSLVGTVLAYILDKKFPKFDWRKFFGMKHKNAEHIAFTIRRNYESNIDACIVTMDSLCDLIFETLFEKYIVGKTYGNYGSMIKNPTMTALLPTTCTSFLQLHELRLESITAHPRNNKTGKATRRLKHYDFYKIRPKVVSAILEITLKVKL